MEIALIVVTVAVISSLGVLAYKKSLEKKEMVNYPSTKQVKDKVPKGNNLTADQKNYRKALSCMEQSDKPEENTEMVNQVEAAVKAAVKASKDSENVGLMEGDIDNKMLMTPPSMVQTFAMVIAVNKYDLKKVEVYQTDKADVLQYVIQLVKEGEEDCYFVGNYNTYADSLQLYRNVGGNIGATFG